MIARHSLIAVLIFLMSVTSGFAAEKAKLGQNGLHEQAWFYPSSMNLQTDLQTATAQGKGLIVLWEQLGCVYCAELHAVNFTREDIVTLITENFLVVQLDMNGVRAVTDIDGQRMTEKQLATKWQVSFTPTTVVLDGSSGQNISPDAAEVFRLPGYLKPFYYHATLDYYASGAYETKGFKAFVAERVAMIESKGLTPDQW
ncbi:MAG: thioredoxin family protein [Rhodobacteraceae bacterium]|nr:thioredoxin family protein [Paracoccaceae bacterium]